MRCTGFRRYAGDLKKALADRMVDAETDVYLAKQTEAGVPNHRNGSCDNRCLRQKASSNYHFHGTGTPISIWH